MKFRNLNLDFDSDYPSMPTYEVSGPANPNKSDKRESSSQWEFPNSEEMYDKEIAQGINHFYKKEDFYYDVNSNGFRCDNFDTMDFTKKSIVYLGCSHTFGCGLPEEDIWTSVLHAMIQKEHNTTYNYINLGVPGGGTDYYLHFLPYLNKFNPKMVISATPDITRASMIDEGEINNLIFGMVDEKKRKSQIEKIYLKLVSIGNEHFEYKQHLILSNVKYVLNLLKINWHEIHHDTFLKILDEGRDNETIKSISRDNLHYPHEAHKIFAELMMDQIKEDK